jgi:hypothetical protein
LLQFWLSVKNSDSGTITVGHRCSGAFLFRSLSFSFARFIALHRVSRVIADSAFATHLRSSSPACAPTGSPPLDPNLRDAERSSTKEHRDRNSQLAFRVSPMHAPRRRNVRVIPTDRDAVCRSQPNKLFVGSNSTQPDSPRYASTHACEAPAEDRSRSLSPW